MKKIKLRELMLMVVPVVALGVFAWKSMQPSPTNKNEKFESTILNVESRSATPRESYEGFDQRIIVNFATTEIPPRIGWKQTSSVFTTLDNKNFATKQSGAWKVIWDEARIRG